MIELFKDKQGWNIRKGICKANCCCSGITDKELLQLYEKIKKTWIIHPTSNVNYYSVGRTIKCGHCEPSDYDTIEPCECICHDKPKSLLGTSKMVIKKGKYTIK